MKTQGGITRRTFLSSAACIALGAPSVISASALGAGGRPAPSNRINVACVGVRNRGTDHLKALLGDPGAQVVAVCDVDAAVRYTALRNVERAYADKTADGTFKGCADLNDFQDVLARPGVDAVTFGTPDHWHALMVLAAVQAGKDIYCEKPLSLTIAEGRAMVEAVRRCGRVCQTGTQRRSDGRIRHICELVRNGRIGKLQRVKVAFGGNNVTCGPTWSPEPVPQGFDYDRWLGPAPWEPYTTLRCHYSFRFILDYSGGQITNNGTHYFDLVQWAMGTDDTGPVEIEGRAEWPTTGLFNTAAKIDFKCTYANGVVLACTTAPDEVRFEGTDGWIDITGKCEPASVIKSAIEPNETHLYEARGGHMGNFLECVRTRRDPSAPVEVGHRSCAISHLGNIAMMLERKVRWDPAAERFVDDPEADGMLARAMRAPWHL